MTPRVSVVVPTFRRPRLVVRAVASALAQSVRAIEVVVVVDGRDAETVAALDGLEDDRVRLVVPERHLGNGAARNHGVALARAERIAFLDDDDVWLPGKLDAQLRCADASEAALPIVTCRLVAETEGASFVWPRRRPRVGEDIAEYLFCRRTPTTGEGLVQTSTLLIPRALLDRIPFDEAMPRYVDVDWLLRAAREPGTALTFAGWPEPLSVWHIERERSRISTSADGAYTLQWAEAHRPFLTPRAFASFVLWRASDDAARGGRHPSFGTLLRAAWRGGRVRAVDLLTHALNYAVPRGLLDRAAAAVGGGG